MVYGCRLIRLCAGRGILGSFFLDFRPDQTLDDCATRIDMDGYEHLSDESRAIGGILTQALHNVRGPYGPFLHSGVSLLSQLRHRTAGLAGGGPRFPPAGVRRFDDDKS
jgi:hypothetical protein